MKDIIVTVISIILIAVIVVVLNNEASKDYELQQTNIDSEIKTSAYRQEKKELQDELDALLAQKNAKEKGVSSLILVFTEVDEAFNQEIVPMLESKGSVATLCLNGLIDEANSFVSPDDIQKLISKGWQTALYWNGVEDLSELSANASSIVTGLGLQMPKVLCVDNSTYDPSFDSTVLACGYDILLVNVGTSDKYIDNSGNGLNKINAHPWYTTSSSSCLSSNDFYNSQLAFFVGTEGNELAYESYQFSAMLNSALSKQSDSSLIITTPDGSFIQIEANEAEYAKSLELYDARVNELKAAIEEIDAKIDGIYSQYN